MEERLKYKQEHEAFFSNLSGGTFSEVLLLLSVAPLSIFCHKVVSCAVFGSQPIPKDKAEVEFRHESVTLLRYLIDFFFTVVPMLVCFTWTEYTVPLLSSMTIIALIISLISKPRILTFGDPSQFQSVSGHRKPFITEYRSAMLLSTFLAILAVDFKVFPRRFAKTETYGISLMDVGVGSFLLASSLTSKQAKGSLAIHPRMKLLWDTLRSVSPLIIIGMGRILSVKATDYQEHVSEYGVHWNFFFTLALVAVLLSIIDAPVEYNAIAATVLILGYQFALSYLGLGEYIKEHPRIDLISQNKEGICSTLGYTALFLYGAQLGSAIMRTKYNYSQWLTFAIKLIAIDVVIFGAALFANYYIEETSRRMVNLSYVLAVLALNIYIISTTLFITLITRPVTNIIIDAINYNGLFMFLLANICTGLTNLSIKTIYVEDEKALGILFVYMFVICGLATLLYKKKICFKFW